MAEPDDKTRGVRGPKPQTVRYPGGQVPHGISQKVEKLRQKYGTDALMNIVGRQGDGTMRSAVRDNDGLGQQMASTNEYPVRMYHADPYDTTAALKRQVGDQLGKATQTTDDLEWLRRKQDQMSAAQFKQFVASLYNTHDPSQKALLHKVYPELLDEQAKILDERLQLMAQLSKIKLYGGPRNRDDLMLLWAINSGAIQLPAGSPWSPDSWTENGQGPDGASVNPIQRGLFSSVKNVKTGKQANRFAPFDMLNSQINATGGGMGQPSIPVLSGNLATGVANAPLW